MKRLVWFCLAAMMLLGVGMVQPSVVTAQGCSISNFTMTPNGLVALGADVYLSVTSNCGTVRFTVDGAPQAEIGSGSQTEVLHR